MYITSWLTCIMHDIINEWSWYHEWHCTCCWQWYNLHMISPWLASGYITCGLCPVWYHVMIRIWLAYDIMSLIAYAYDIIWYHMSSNMALQRFQKHMASYLIWVSQSHSKFGIQNTDKIVVLKYGRPNSSQWASSPPFWSY